MAKAHSKLTAQGQISVPAEVRRELGLAPGSVLEWQQEGAHYVVRRATRHTSEEIHQALFAESCKSKTLAELKAGIKRRVRQKHARG